MRCNHFRLLLNMDLMDSEASAEQSSFADSLFNEEDEEDEEARAARKTPYWSIKPGRCTLVSQRRRFNLDAAFEVPTALQPLSRTLKARRCPSRAVRDSIFTWRRTVAITPRQQYWGASTARLPVSNGCGRTLQLLQSVSDWRLCSSHQSLGIELYLVLSPWQVVVYACSQS